MSPSRLILALSSLALAIAATPLPLAFSGMQTSQPTDREVVLQLVAKDKQAVPGWYREARPSDAKAGDESWRESANVVVLLHMYSSQHRAWKPILPEFAARGISTLSIDMRGHGINLEGPEGQDLAKLTSDADREHFLGMYQDAFAVIDWLEQRGFKSERIGILGASVGSSVSIDAARRRPGLGPVGALTPGLNYLGIPTVEYIKEWGERELLIVTSEEEAPGGPAPLRDYLQDAFQKRSKDDPTASDHLTYWELEETDIHGTSMFGKVPGIEGRIAQWYAERFDAIAAPELSPKAKSR